MFLCDAIKRDESLCGYSMWLYGDLFHHPGAFLLEGRGEQDTRRGFSSLVRRIYDLGEIMSGAGVLSPQATPR